MKPIDQLPARRRTVIPILAIVVLCGVAYWNTVGSGFVYDDNAIVAYNPLVKSLGNLPRIFTTNYWGIENANSGLYRPLTIASFCVDHAIWKLNPAAFHLLNMLWHALASVLAYLFVRRALGQPRTALIAAALFAVHPLHVEAVSGIVGRSEIMAASFMLAGALAHLRYRTSRRRIFLAAAVAAYMGALLSKETSILFPLLPLVLDTGMRLPGAADRVSRTERGWWYAYPAYGAALIAVYMLRFAVLGPHQLTGPTFVSLMDNPLYDLPALPRMATALYVLLRYLGLMAFPLHLSADYSYDQIPAVLGIQDWRGAAALAVLSFMLWLSVRSFRRNPAVTLALALFWIPFLPVSNLVVPIGTIMAERMVYFPLLGFALMAALVLDRGLERPRFRPATLVLTGLILAALTGRTLRRNLDWRDDATLFTAALDVVPRSSRIRLYLGRHENMKGDHESALDNLSRSLEILPRNPETVAEIGHAHIGLGNLDLAEERFREATSYDPDYVGAYYGLGRIYRQQGQYERALWELRRCVELVPMHMAARFDIGIIHYVTGDYGEAQSAFEAILKLDPSSLGAEYYLGLMERTQGNPGGQRARYERVVRSARPFDVEGYNYLGLIHEELGDLESAYANLVVARSLNPLSSFTGTNLARHLIRRGAVTEAMAEARTVLETNPHSVEALQILGYGQTLRGRFADAESTLTRARSYRPRDARTAMHLGRMFAASGRETEAEQAFLSARMLEPHDVEPLMAQAAFERDRGRHEVARRLYERARGFHPVPAAVELELVRVDAAAGDTAAARARLARVERQDLPTPELRYLLGLAQEDCGRIADARTTMHAALHAQPRHGRTLYRTAVLELRTARYAEAESLLARLLELYPEHADGKNALAWALLQDPGFREEDLSRALALSEEALAADSSRAAYHDTRAEALWRSGRPEDARRAWRRAAALEPERGDYARKAREGSAGRAAGSGGSP